MNFVEDYFMEVVDVCNRIDKRQLEEVVKGLIDLRENRGRLFILGVGGSAANASHASNDFRKLAGIESYAPTDNVAEFTARANDEGWDSTFVGYLQASNLSKKDSLLILSVGGGDIEKNISVNLCRAADYAKNVGCTIYAISGRKEGYVQSLADIFVFVQINVKDFITPLSESFQALVWHLVVSHPELKLKPTKW